MKGEFSTQETYAEQIVAESCGCFICGKKTTIWMVKDRGYCADHKKYAEDARKRLAGIVDSFHGTALEAQKSAAAKRNAHRAARINGFRRT
jgi:hypothetical protein